MVVAVGLGLLASAATCGPRTMRDRLDDAADRPAATKDRAPSTASLHQPTRPRQSRTRPPVPPRRGVPHRDDLVDLLRQTLRDDPDPRAVSGSTRSHATARADPTTQRDGRSTHYRQSPSRPGSFVRLSSSASRESIDFASSIRRGPRLRSPDPAGVLIRACCDLWSWCSEWSVANATTLSRYRCEVLSNSPPHVMSLSPAWSTPPKTARVGNSDFSYFATCVTSNTATRSSSRATSTRSPRRSSASRKKTPGTWFQVTWPAMTAGPSSPGVGPRRYQPAIAGSSGTCIAPRSSIPKSNQP